MKIQERLELDDQGNTLTVRGITYSQQPYEIEILSSRGSRLWGAYLRLHKFHRKCVGDYKDRPDKYAPIRPSVPVPYGKHSR